LNSSSRRAEARALPFRLSLKAKLYVGFLFFALAGFTAAAVLVDRFVRASAQSELEDRLTYETTMLGQMTANALFGDIDPTDTSLNASVRALGASVHTELSVIAQNGVVVADSESDSPLSLPPQTDEPEIRGARDTGTGTALRDGRLFVATVIQREGRQLGFARSSVALEVILDHVRGVRRRMAYGALLSIVIAIVLGYAISARLVRPMRALSMVARRVGAGELAQPIPVTSRDEIAELSIAFNGMLDDLRQTIAKLDERNRDMRLVLDNVSQGLLTVDQRGIISPERSAVLDVWFGPATSDTTLWDYLGRNDEQAGGMFQCVWEELVEGVMPFEVAFGLLPAKMTANGRQYELRSTPLGDWTEQGAPARGMLIMISDVTARLSAERAEGEQREIAGAFERIMSDRNSFAEFFRETHDLVDRVCGDGRPPLPTTRRLLHTLKGNAAVFGLTRFASLCHAVEERMLDSGADVSGADREELVTNWRRLAARLRAVIGERAEVKLDVDDEDYDDVLRALLDGQSRSDVARRIAAWRLERVDTRLGRFADQARDLASRLGKGTIDVVVEAARLRLSRDVLGPFWATLTHVVRNAVDHGVEYPEVRARAGKTPRARLVLSARRSGDEVALEVSDDGAGVDWEAVAARARELGLPSSGRRDWTAALFHDGLSTKKGVTEVSGRGIGLGAARTECEKLGGTVTVMSELGHGTTFRFTFATSTVIPAHATLEEAVRAARSGREAAAVEPVGFVGNLAGTRA
jgi:two-component system chemotaxis sensor kinase CheA